MKTISALNSLQMALLGILIRHVGKENKISRSALLDTLHRGGFSVTDQTMRKNIEILRFLPEGALICSTTASEGGYWYAKNLDEVIGYIKQDERRAKSILYRLSRQQKRAARAMTMDSLPIKD